jgi:hypothetical protein
VDDQSVADQPADDQPVVAKEIPAAPPRLELTANLAVTAAPWAQPVGDEDDAAPASAPTPAMVAVERKADTAWADAAAADAIRNAEAALAGEAAPRATGVPPGTAKAGGPQGAQPAEPSRPPVSAGQAVATPYADPASDEASDDLILDETVLREIIRDVVREELAGSLGARITRNVRKLIRGEIAQVLAARRLE